MSALYIQNKAVTYRNSVSRFSKSLACLRNREIPLPAPFWPVPLNRPVRTRRSTHASTLEIQETRRIKIKFIIGAKKKKQCMAIKKQKIQLQNLNLVLLNQCEMRNSSRASPVHLYQTASTLDSPESWFYPGPCPRVSSCFLSSHQARTYTSHRLV
jgi:hypothetical protein